MSFFGCRQNFRKQNPCNGDSFCWASWFSWSSLHAESAGEKFDFLTNRTLMAQRVITTRITTATGRYNVYSSSDMRWQFWWSPAYLCRRKKNGQKYNSETNFGLSDKFLWRSKTDATTHLKSLSKEHSYYKTSCCRLSPPLCARIDYRNWRENDHD